MFFSFLTSIFSTGENCTDLNILDKEYLYSISRQDNLIITWLVGILPKILKRKSKNILVPVLQFLKQWKERELQLHNQFSLYSLSILNEFQLEN